MGAWKRVLISSVLIVWIVSGSWANPVQQNAESGRSAKVLEDPIVPHDGVSSENTDLQDSSERSLSLEQNMMLYRSVFTLSLKLLAVFLLVKLLSYGLTSAGIIRPLGGPAHAELYYPVDVLQNPAAGWAQQPATGWTQQPTAGWAQQPAVVAGDAAGGGVAADPSGGVIVTTGVVTSGVVPVTVGGYDIAATNSKPSFLAPTGPRFRFGLRPFGRHPPPRPRHPPMMHPHLGSVPSVVPMTHSAQNMGEETHLVETHSHLLIAPDGSQMRVPVAGQKPVVSVLTNATPASSQKAPPKTPASTTEAATPGESSSSPPKAAERRSSLASSSTVFRDKHRYGDWNHYSPGARSL